MKVYIFQILIRVICFKDDDDSGADRRDSPDRRPSSRGPPPRKNGTYTLLNLFISISYGKIPNRFCLKTTEQFYFVYLQMIDGQAPVAVIGNVTEREHHNAAMTNPNEKTDLLGELFIRNFLIFDFKITF